MKPLISSKNILFLIGISAISCLLFLFFINLSEAQDNESQVILDGFSSNNPLMIDYSGNVQTDVQLQTLDSQFILYIPAGTIVSSSNGSVIKILSCHDVYPLPDSPDGSRIIAVYSFGPDGVKFTPSFTASFKYDPATLSVDTDENDLYIAWWDDTRWVRVSDSKVDPVSDHITFVIDSFKRYAVLGTITPEGAAAELTEPPSYEEITPSRYEITITPTQPQSPQTVTQNNIEYWLVTGGLVVISLILIILLFRQIRNSSKIE
jgi:hypothetical protein